MRTISKIAWMLHRLFIVIAQRPEQAVVRARAEAMLIPSCTRFPEGNLIIFPDCLQTGSSIVVVEGVDPNLYVDWDRLV